MATLGEAKVNIRANLKPLRAGLKQARQLVVKSMASLAIGTLKGVSRAIKRSMGMLITALKRLAKIIAVTLVGIGIASTKAFVNFQNQLQTVNTMLTKQTEQLLPGYAIALQKISITFGESTQTLSTGLFNILSASIDASKAIKVLTITAKAATAGLTDTSTAAFAITGILNAYGMAADQAGKISDVLFATVKRGQTTFNRLAPAIGRVTAIAASAGISIEQVGAALATITRGGISTNEAVTSLRMALIALQGQNEQGVKIAKEHGIELSVQSLRTKGLTGKLKELQRLNPEVLKNIFKEIRARVGINVLLKDQTGFVSDLELAMNSAGLTEEAFAKRTSTLGFRFKQVRQEIVALGVKIGSVLSVDVKTALNNFSSFLKDNEGAILGWAETIKEKTKDIFGWFSDLFKLFKEDPGAALDIIREKVNKLFEQLKKGFFIAVEAVKPFAVELGKLIAEGFISVLKQAGKAVGENIASRTTPGQFAKDVAKLHPLVAIPTLLKLNKDLESVKQSIQRQRDIRMNIERRRFPSGDGSTPGIVSSGDGPVALQNISRSLKNIELSIVRVQQFGELA